VHYEHKARGVSARTKGQLVDAEKLKHFENLLLNQLRQFTEQIRTDQAAALELYDDGVKDSVDLSVQDLNKEIALRLGERSSQVVADIDQALLRIKEGTYGMCARCGKPIDERRLEALPTARYDAACQAAIENADGEEDLPTL
jgi:RNA polymerase-binding transcription factor